MYAYYDTLKRNRSQDVVDICLEMFNCLSAEQTVAMRKTKFMKRLSNSGNMRCQTFAAETAKKLATLPRIS